EKRMPETFVFQDPTKISEMYSQPVNKYFNEASISSLEPEPLLVLMEDVNSCTVYLRSWDSHYNHCIREIRNQEYKMLKLIYSLSKVFFKMLKICNQEQDNEKVIEKNTGYWKERNIKSQINKLWNISSCSMLKKWKGYWRLCYFLWVTNITPKEIVDVKLDSNFFLYATEDEYNFLIKKLLGKEFSNFSNIKGEKILDLANIAKKVCK
ncbi:5992_t:CDS:1, partial [Racocetra persica]